VRFSSRPLLPTTHDSTIVLTRWIYGLLARLEKPLYQDAAATIRSLYRSCAQRRAALAESLLSAERECQLNREEKEGGESVRDQQEGESERIVSDVFKDEGNVLLACFNLLAILSGVYFGQSEYEEIPANGECDATSCDA